MRHAFHFAFIEDRLLRFAFAVFALPAFATLRRIADFAPDILVLAAGLDIAVDDPFKGFAIETQDFEDIGRLIADLGRPMLVVQEGGYPSPHLGANLASLLKGLGG